MSKIILQYKAGVSESDSKLYVVKQLRDIIEDELLNPGKSFIQVNEFNSKLKDLQMLVKKSGDTLYTPIIATLVELASEQNFSDQKILKAILSNLKALEENINKFKAEKKTALKVTLKTLKAQEQNLVGQLQDYAHLEQRYVSDVTEANENTAVLTDTLLNLNNEIARKEDELRNIDHLCDTENKMFKDGVTRVDAVKKDVNNAINHVMNLHSK